MILWLDWEETVPFSPKTGEPREYRSTNKTAVQQPHSNQTQTCTKTQHGPGAAARVTQLASPSSYRQRCGMVSRNPKIEV
jgi:hypothetical protein